MMDAIRRDDVSFQLTFTDKDGNAIDLTGGTVYFTVKKGVYDTDAQAVISKEITSFDDPTLGIAVLNLTKTDTDIPAKIYHYDIQLKDSAGSIASSDRGRFVINQDVTVRIS